MSFGLCAFLFFGSVGFSDGCLIDGTPVGFAHVPQFFMFGTNSASGVQVSGVLESL